MIKVSIKKLNKIKKCRMQSIQREMSLHCNPTSSISASVKHTENKILELITEYPENVLRNFPPVVFVHQLLHSELVNVKNDIEILASLGIVIKINLPSVSPPEAVLHFKTFTDWINEYHKPDRRIMEFIQRVLPKIKSSAVHKEILREEFKLTEFDIKCLINFGLLALARTDVYSLTFPGAGVFCKTFNTGRSAIVAALKRTADNEILVNELVTKRTIVNNIHFGINFFINDIIGLNVADSIETTNGLLIRYIGV